MSGAGCVSSQFRIPPGTQNIKKTVLVPVQPETTQWLRPGAAQPKVAGSNPPRFSEERRVREPSPIRRLETIGFACISEPGRLQTAAGATPGPQNSEKR